MGWAGNAGPAQDSRILKSTSAVQTSLGFQTRPSSLMGFDGCLDSGPAVEFDGCLDSFENRVGCRELSMVTIRGNPEAQKWRCHPVTRL